MNDEVAWQDYSDRELAELALGPDLWLNAPALSQLGERSPEAARSVAMEALRRDDALLQATALRVLAESDMDSALEYMRRAVMSAPLAVLDSMVEIIAVDHMVDGSSESDLLTNLVGRLWPPAGSREYNLADLLFRRYPQLRPSN
jgi:hypothetical protein